MTTADKAESDERSSPIFGETNAMSNINHISHDHLAVIGRFGKLLPQTSTITAHSMSNIYTEIGDE